MASEAKKPATPPGSEPAPGPAGVAPKEENSGFPIPLSKKSSNIGSIINEFLSSQEAERRRQEELARQAAAEYQRRLRVKRRFRFIVFGIGGSVVLASALVFGYITVERRFPLLVAAYLRMAGLKDVAVSVRPKRGQTWREQLASQSQGPRVELVEVPNFAARIGDARLARLGTAADQDADSTCPALGEDRPGLGALVTDGVRDALNCLLIRGDGAKAWQRLAPVRAAAADAVFAGSDARLTELLLLTFVSGEHVGATKELETLTSNICRKPQISNGCAVAALFNSSLRQSIGNLWKKAKGSKATAKSLSELGRALFELNIAETLMQNYRYTGAFELYHDLLLDYASRAVVLRAVVLDKAVLSAFLAGRKVDVERIAKVGEEQSGNFGAAFDEWLKAFAGRATMAAAFLEGGDGREYASVIRSKWAVDAVTKSPTATQIVALQGLRNGDTVDALSFMQLALGQWIESGRRVDAVHVLTLWVGRLMIAAGLQLTCRSTLIGLPGRMRLDPEIRWLSGLASLHLSAAGLADSNAGIAALEAVARNRSWEDDFALAWASSSVEAARPRALELAKKLGARAKRTEDKLWLELLQARFAATAGQEAHARTLIERVVKATLPAGSDAAKGLESLVLRVPGKESSGDAMYLWRTRVGAYAPIGPLGRSLRPDWPRDIAASH